MSTKTLHFIRRGEEAPSCIITTTKDDVWALEDLFRAANRVDGSEEFVGPHAEGFNIVQPLTGPSMSVGDAALMISFGDGASMQEMWFVDRCGWSKTPIDNLLFR